MREAEVHLGQLVNMLRAPGIAALPGTVAIVAVKAAGSIAQQRPFFMNKVLPVLIGLGSTQVCFDVYLFTDGNLCSWKLQHLKRHNTVTAAASELTYTQILSCADLRHCAHCL